MFFVLFLFRDLSLWCCFSLSLVLRRVVASPSIWRCCSLPPVWVRCFSSSVVLVSRPPSSIFGVVVLSPPPPFSVVLRGFLLCLPSSFSAVPCGWCYLLPFPLGGAVSLIPSFGVGCCLPSSLVLFRGMVCGSSWRLTTVERQGRREVRTQSLLGRWFLGCCFFCY